MSKQINSTKPSNTGKVSPGNAPTAVNAARTAASKPFTENWLQTLTLSVGSPSARLVKPLINDIDSVSQTRDPAEQLQAAERLWQFAHENKLLPLLKLLPTQQQIWSFSEEETFNFERRGSKSIETKEDWLAALGIVPYQFELTATVTSGDWAEHLRREAVRLRKTLSAQAMQSSSTLDKATVAQWKDAAWHIHFVEADWVVLRYEEAFETDRPSVEEAEEAIITSLIEAEPLILSKTLPNTSVASVDLWADSVPRLKPLHQRFLAEGKTNSNLWVRRAWAAVWPVIYREQNQLTKPCDIDWIRRELAECFQNVPKATLWMFVAAKLVCSSQLGRGLSVCGNFKRS